jgi:hypothetical protein
MMADLYRAEWAHPVGSNADVDSAAAEDAWAGGGVYPWPEAAAATTIVSASANDAAEGTGARTVQVVGLLASGVAVRETVMLTGTDAVTLVNAYLRILDARVLTAGSGGVNAGALSVKHASTTIGVVPAGAGRLNGALYTVPGGRRARIGAWTVAAGSATAGYVTGSLLVRPSGGAWQTLDIVDHTARTQPEARRLFAGFPLLEPLTDVRVSVASSADNMTAVARLELLIEAAF